MIDVTVNSVQSLVWQTAKLQVHERRYFETVNGNQTVRSEYYYIPLYDRHGQTVQNTEQGQQIDRRA